MTTLADQAIQMSKPNCANFSRASLTVRITFPEVRNRKGTESGLGRWYLGDDHNAR